MLGDNRCEWVVDVWGTAVGTVLEMCGGVCGTALKMCFGDSTLDWFRDV